MPLLRIEILCYKLCYFIVVFRMMPEHRAFFEQFNKYINCIFDYCMNVFLFNGANLVSEKFSLLSHCEMINHLLHFQFCRTLIN